MSSVVVGIRQAVVVPNSPAGPVAVEIRWVQWRWPQEEVVVGCDRVGSALHLRTEDRKRPRCDYSRERRSDEVAGVVFLEDLRVKSFREGLLGRGVHLGGLQYYYCCWYRYCQRSLLLIHPRHHPGRASRAC